MTDRELLARAAKAAGYQIHSDAWACVAGGGGETLYMGNNGPAWNPIADDGDAMRLANRLRMRIEHHVRHPFVAVFSGTTDSGIVKAEEPHLDDVDAATRRAIVRAAAEIVR